MSTKILIIGQAPPAVKQQYPYDTTMLYDWLHECGVSKQDAQGIFIFEAMSNTFPGFDERGGHLKPSMDKMSRHYETILLPLIRKHPKIITLGNVPRDFFKGTPVWLNNNIKKLCLIHPSKRNYALFQKNREHIIKSLKEFIEQP